MTNAVHRSILKRLALSIWGLATLVLFFCVVLLAKEMIDTGRDPLSYLRAPAAPDATPPEARYRPQLPPAAQEVALYFGSIDARHLAPEIHLIGVTDSTVENCRHALQELIQGPRDILTPILPATAKIRALYLLDNGELVIDFSRELQSEHMRLKSASLECLMIYGVVNTLMQSALQSKTDPPIRQVRFLVEGSPPQEGFPSHIDLSEPVKADPRWSAPDDETSFHG